MCFAHWIQDGISGKGFSTIAKEGWVMAKQVPWETIIEVALDRSTKEQKPIFVDFWFDG